MVSPIYEVDVVCNNCGATDRRTRVDSATFERLAERDDAALPDLSPDERTLLDEGDLGARDGELPVEVLVRHVGVCRWCAASP